MEEKAPNLFSVHDAKLSLVTKEASTARPDIGCSHQGICATLVRACTSFLVSTFGKNWRKWAKYPLQVLISGVEWGQCVDHRPGHGKEDDFLWQASKGKVWALLTCLHLSSLSDIILSIPKKWQEIFNSTRTNMNSWKTSQISCVIATLYWQTFPRSDI